jgi:large subunit ribosomal protein L10
MAISRDKKTEIVADLNSLLDTAKLSVFAYYDGINVAQAQELRKLAKAQGTKIRVVKNRLVKVALSQSEKYKDMETTSLNGQLLYAFSDQDEVTSAQTLYNFAKANPDLKIAGGFNQSAILLSSDQVKVIAQLPNEEQLKGQIVKVLAAPITGVINVLSANIKGLINVLNARVQAE